MKPLPFPPVKKLKADRQYVVLAMHYNSIGKPALRDKYIEAALRKKHTDDIEIFLRGLQGKPELLDKDTINREIKREKANKDWSQLARLYVDIHDWENAVKYYFKSVRQDLATKNYFSAAFYLKEMAERKLYNPLFEKAYSDAVKRKDEWCQRRALEELGHNNKTSKSSN